VLGIDRASEYGYKVTVVTFLSKAFSSGGITMKEAIETAISLMAASARTAPKAGGKDFLEIVVITRGEELKRIAETMRDHAPRSTKCIF
jgi:20S proteasome alpha/beta subunit